MVVYLLIPTSNHNYLDCVKYWCQVVYLLIPTSNHNLSVNMVHRHCVVYLLIPTSNHNITTDRLARDVLYIFWFLHQTTTIAQLLIFAACCISFDSYIKPQRFAVFLFITLVVYLLIPTSNHNQMPCVNYKTLVVYLLIPTSNHNKQLLIMFNIRVVYLLIPTSNHNCLIPVKVYDYVVYLLIPTSNHNSREKVFYLFGLYIFWFLHQTTTLSFPYPFLSRCISFDSYIKPQRLGYRFLLRKRCISFDSYIKPQPTSLVNTAQTVVYLLIPTSNHNVTTFVTYSGKL